jgi:hypothetical protein
VTVSYSKRALRCGVRLRGNVPLAVAILVICSIFRPRKSPPVSLWVYVHILYINEVSLKSVLAISMHRTSSRACSCIFFTDFRIGTSSQGTSRSQRRSVTGFLLVSRPRSPDQNVISILYSLLWLTSIISSQTMVRELLAKFLYGLRWKKLDTGGCLCAAII